jgi:hypothetical protein
VRVVGAFDGGGRLDGRPGDRGQEVAAIGLVADGPARVDDDVVHRDALGGTRLGRPHGDGRGPVEVVEGDVLRAHDVRR